MKRKYKAPEIEIESFQLDAALAASCQINMHQDADIGCSLDIYYADYCLEDVTMIDAGDPYCYHGPLGFGSFIAS